MLSKVIHESICTVYINHEPLRILVRARDGIVCYSTRITEQYPAAHWESDTVSAYRNWQCEVIVTVFASLRSTSKDPIPSWLISFPCHRSSCCRIFQITSSLLMMATEPLKVGMNVFVFIYHAHHHNDDVQ
jgi:hypothetical protein